jgi:hypothetical protein
MSFAGKWMQVDIIVLSKINQTQRLKKKSPKIINKELSEFYNALYQIDLRNSYRIFKLTEKYTFFSAAHAIFSNIDHILGHKISLKNIKKIEVTSFIYHIIVD